MWRQILECVLLMTFHFNPPGGTSVTEALACPEHEKRMIVSLDTSQMVRLTKHIVNLMFDRFHSNVIIVLVR